MRKVDLSRHVEKEHTDGATGGCFTPNPNCAVSFKCNFCAKQFTEKRNLVRHTNTIHKGKF